MKVEQSHWKLSPVALFNVAFGALLVGILLVNLTGTFNTFDGPVSGGHFIAYGMWGTLFLTGGVTQMLNARNKGECELRFRSPMLTPKCSVEKLRWENTFLGLGRLKFFIGAFFLVMVPVAFLGDPKAAVLTLVVYLIMILISGSPESVLEVSKDRVSFRTLLSEQSHHWKELEEISVRTLASGFFLTLPKAVVHIKLRNSRRMQLHGFPCEELEVQRLIAFCRDCFEESHSKQFGGKSTNPWFGRMFGSDAPIGIHPDTASGTSIVE